MFKELVVIELASVLAGPSVGMFLAELGARVIKVENLSAGGDVTRTWHLSSEDRSIDRPAYFCSANWGKESIAVNLKTAEGKEVVYELAKKADIIISSYIPGTDKKLGVDGPSLQQHNPQLICAEINGYGYEESRAAFDAIIQAESGFTYLNGEKGKGLCKMPVALIDVLAGHQLKEAILLAWIKRLQTGEGSIVRVSLIDAALASLVNQATNWLVAGFKPQALGSEHPNIVPYGSVFYTADKLPIVTAIGNDRQFEALAELLGLVPDPRFKTNTLRIQHKAVLLEKLASKIHLWERKALLKACMEHNIPLSAVNQIHEALELPQAERLILENESCKGLRSFVAQEPNEKEEPPLLPPPHFGEHTQQILSGFLDWKQDGIEELIANNVVG